MQDRYNTDHRRFDLGSPRTVAPEEKPIRRVMADKRVANNYAPYAAKQAYDEEAQGQSKLDRIRNEQSRRIKAIPNSNINQFEKEYHKRMKRYEDYKYGTNENEVHDKSHANRRENFTNFAVEEFTNTASSNERVTKSHADAIILGKRKQSDLSPQKQVDHNKLLTLRHGRIDTDDQNSVFSNEFPLKELNMTAKVKHQHKLSESLNPRMRTPYTVKIDNIRDYIK